MSATNHAGGTATVTDEATAANVLAAFSEPVAEWFRTTFRLPTIAQARGWPAIAGGDHTLLLAPTGSGKTLTAFLHAIDRLMTDPWPADERRTRVVYLSPLKALATDIDRNLRAPLRGIQLAAERLGSDVVVPTVGVRTGDTPPNERARMKRTPPDVLITTPESFYLYLTSKGRETLRDVETVIIDEIHAMAATKRGTHLALSMERLEEEVLRGGTDAFGSATGEVTRERHDGTPARPPQRVALSATQRPLEEIARFLGGQHADPDGEVDPDTGRVRRVPRPVEVVDAGVTKQLEVEVVVPVEDLGAMGEQAEPEYGGPGSITGQAPARTSIWPSMVPELLDAILEHRSTICFVNARRLAERLAAQVNDLHAARRHRDRLAQEGYDVAIDGEGRLAGTTPDGAMLDEADAAVAEILAETVPELVRAHHGSIAKDQRTRIEDDLKAGRVRGIISTSSLELGIDMGAVDLVLQVASPGAVSRGLQRIGRAGHQVGEPSRGKLFPKFRGDLVETAVVVQRMRTGEIESTHYPRSPLDVLAQQVVATVAMDDWTVEGLGAMVRRAAPYSELSDEVLHAVLDLLAGRYPSEEFSELRPRLVWDRVEGTLRGRRGAQRLAVTNPGTIPDRGLFGVFTPDGQRVGELDEEMVHETRPGETFLLGATTWRIEDITYDRVVVTPAPGEPGRMPFWRGEGPGRPYELGAALGAFQGEVAAAIRDGETEALYERLRTEHALERRAANNVVGYLSEQLEASGVVPSDTQIVVERFRDEIGDWRICVLSPFGSQVHAPWAMALERTLTDAGFDPEVLWADDGIVLRLLDADRELPDTLLEVDPDEVEALVTEQLAGTAMFTTAFREAAGRALLLPKRRPDQRTALWQQRQRAANLLQVASRHSSFPILLEATRECLRDVFDLPALRDLLEGLRSRRIRVARVESEHASPFASSLLFAWVGQYMYEYDAPLAERRAAALSLDRDLLRDLLGGDELRDLLDLEVLHELEAWLQRRVEGRRARDPDELHDALRELGPLSLPAAVERAEADEATVTAWLQDLVEANRAIAVRVADTAVWAAAEDAARLRDALGVALPPGLPAVFTEPPGGVAQSGADQWDEWDPMAELVGRYARTHGPFTQTEVAEALGSPVPRVGAALRHLVAGGRVLEGAFRPGGRGTEYVDNEVLRRLRRRSLAALRSEVEAVEPQALARFLPSWHAVRTGSSDPRGRGLEGLADVLTQLQGFPLPASVLESDVLADRVRDYSPALLDQLVAAGEVVWFGAEPLGSSDGRVVLCFRDQAHLLAPERSGEPPGSELHVALRDHLDQAGASFWPDLFAASGVPDQDEVLAALWDLVWAGEVTNDTLAPLRGLLSSGTSGGSRRRRGRPGALRRLGPPAAQGRWSSTASLRTAVRDETVGTARAGQLLQRWGVVTADAVRGEGHRGGFAGVYEVFKAMEETGQVRRGYFVEGLGGAQFAPPGAVDRLRDHREPPRDPVVVRLAATDPAQAYGAALPWPETDGHPARQAGAHVLTVDGHCVLYVERGGRSLVTFPRTFDTAEVWGPALAALVTDGPVAKLEVTRIDSGDAFEHPLAEVLEELGLTAGYRGLVLRG